MHNDSTGAPSEYDPYHKLLGIPKRDQPPNLYRLLGVESLESDRDVIDAAANKQMAYLRDCCNGEHAAEAERLLNEVSEARLRLLNPASKQQYDAELESRFASPPPIPVAAPIPANSPATLTPAQPQPSRPSVQPVPNVSPTGSNAPRIRVGTSSRGRRKRSSPFRLLLSILIPSGLTLLIAWKTGLLTQQHIDLVSKQITGSSESVPSPQLEPLQPFDPEPTPDDSTPQQASSTYSSTGRGVDGMASRPATDNPSTPGGPTIDGRFPRPVGAGQGTGQGTGGSGFSNDAMQRLRSFRSLASGGNDYGGLVQHLPASDLYIGPRLPMPPADEIDATTEEVRSILAPKIEDAKSPHEKRHFATVCYQLANETEPPPAKYVLLRMSWDFFRQANDFTGAMLVLDAIAARFETDVSTRRSETIIELTPKLHRPSEQVAAADRAEAMIQVALKAEDYQTMIELGRIGKRLAMDFKNIDMNKKFTSLIEQAVALQQSHSMVQTARTKLLLEPDNPKANEYLGRFRCFGKAEWSEGLPMLRRAENRKLAEVAELELRLPTDAASAENLADRWWELAALSTDEPALASGCRERAVHWYRQALANGLSGLSRAAAQTRIDTYSDENGDSLALRSAANTDQRTPTPPRNVPPEAIHFDGNWYLFSNREVRFEVAVGMATRAGGRLVVVRSEAENAFLLQHANRPLMLGMLKRNGVWYDALGEKQYFFLWDQQAGQPKGGPDKPIAALFRRTNLWHDFPDVPMYFAIEWGKE